MTKVFVRTSDLGNDRPIILASYADNTIIADDAHGEGVTVLTLPANALGGPSPGSFGMASLIGGWRQQAGDLPVKAEARRRIESVFSTADQLNALFDIVDTITKHGADMSKWPADVQQRKLSYDEGRKYVTEVRDKVRAHSTTMPRDPASDRIWPARPKK